MALQTILVHLDTGPRSIERVGYAIKLALAHDAHLIGLAPTDELRLPALYQQYGTSARPAIAPVKELQELAREAIANFEKAVDHVDLRSFESRIDANEAGVATVLHGRYADLIVIGQTDLSLKWPTTAPDFPDFVLLNAGRPLLIIPYAGTFHELPTKIDIAWDASREAARAVTDAMPILIQADVVRVVTFNAKASLEGHGEVPGADIATYLARHGVKVEVVQDHTGIAISDALLSQLADGGADLLVMGGYGHARFREIILGGVTRSVFEQMTCPVLVSH